MRALFTSVVLLLPAIILSQEKQYDTCDFYEFSISIQIQEEAFDKDIQFIFDNLNYYSDDFDHGTLYLINQGTSIEEYTLQMPFYCDTLSIKLNPFEADTLYRLTRAIFNFGYTKNRTVCDTYLPLVYDGEYATIELDLGFRGNHHIVHLRYAKLDERYNKLIAFIKRKINAQ